MNSKSVLWLGLLFVLLLSVFCITTHLDDLNPQIENLKTPPQEHLAMPTAASTTASQKEPTAQSPLFVPVPITEMNRTRTAQTKAPLATTAPKPETNTSTEANVTAATVQTSEHNRTPLSQKASIETPRAPERNATQHAKKASKVHTPHPLVAVLPPHRYATRVPSTKSGHHIHRPIKRRPVGKRIAHRTLHWYPGQKAFSFEQKRILNALLHPVRFDPRKTLLVTARAYNMPAGSARRVARIAKNYFSHHKIATGRIYTRSHSYHIPTRSVQEVTLDITVIQRNRP